MCEMNFEEFGKIMFELGKIHTELERMDNLFLDERVRGIQTLDLLTQIVDSINKEIKW